MLKLNDEVGLHPSMTGLKRNWDNWQLGIVQGCGYPNPNRSTIVNIAQRQSLAVQANLHAPVDCRRQLRQSARGRQGLSHPDLVWFR